MFQESSDESDNDRMAIIQRIQNSVQSMVVNDDAKEIWKDRCYKEIPREFLSKIMQTACPTILFEDYSNIARAAWTACYFSYRRWKTFPYREMGIISITEFPLISTEKRVSCISTWKYYLAIGTSNGEIIVFNLSNLNIPSFGFSTNTGKIIKIVFWKLNVNNPIIVSLSSLSIVKFWDLVNQTNLSEGFSVQGNNICTGTARNLLIENQGIIKDYQFLALNSDNFGNAQVQFKLDLLDNESIITMYSERDEMLVLSKRDKYVRIFHLKIPTADRQYFELIKTSPHIALIDLEIDYDSCNYQIVNMNLIVGLFGNFVCFLTTTDYNWHVNTSEPCKNIQSIVMYGNLLIFGMKSGQVKLTPVDNDKFFMKKIDKYMCFSRSVRVINDSILLLNITEFNKISYVIAATRRKVFCFWPVPSSSGDV